MFKAFVQDIYGNTIKEYEDCFKVAIYSERDMQMLFPEQYNAYGMHCPYLQLVDSQGNHFYPLYYYSVEIG